MEPELLEREVREPWMRARSREPEPPTIVVR